jgi:hypothetical protein
MEKDLATMEVTDFGSMYDSPAYRKAILVYEVGFWIICDSRPYAPT